VSAEHVFEVRGLHASAGGREVLHGIDLTVRSGEVHVIMGPNGSGKSTLAHALMGRPGTEVSEGSITMDGRELTGLPAWERARAGLFLALQHPVEVPGVSLTSLLAAATSGDAEPATAWPTRRRRWDSTRSCCAAPSTSTCRAGR
jgi:Fe-S cluster assembly ATP-binding protein